MPRYPVTIYIHDNDVQVVETVATKVSAGKRPFEPLRSRNSSG
jgi:hypothetical protein